MKNTNKKQKSYYQRKRDKERRKHLMTKYLTILICFLGFPSMMIMGVAKYTGDEIMQLTNTTTEIISKQTQFELYEVIEEFDAVVTQYNAGDPSQTDNSPCIGANQENVCSLVGKGECVIANNDFSFGTIIEIEGFGNCRVVDRMNSRYTLTPEIEIDIAMPAEMKKEAIKFGKPTLKARRVRKINL